MAVITGVEGTYNANTNQYDPPEGYDIWKKVVQKKQLKINIKNNLCVLPKAKQEDLIAASQPIKNCYWVILGKLLAGEYPRSKDKNTSILKISSLIDAGISAFVDLTEQNEGLLPYADLIGNVLYQRFPVRDVSIPDSFEYTKNILNSIDNHIKNGRTVYLHCYGGVG